MADRSPTSPGQPETAPESKTLQVSRLAWEMAQFELHWARNKLTALWNTAIADGRRAQEQRAEYEAVMLRALRDRAHRCWDPSAEMAAEPQSGPEVPPGESDSPDSLGS